MSDDEGLAPHPYAFLVVDRSEGIPSVIRLYCPIPAAALRETRIAKGDDEELFALLLRIADTQQVGDLLCSEEHAEFLVSAGFLVSPDAIDRVTFPCTLDERLLEALPRRVQRTSAELPVATEVNPSLSVEYPDGAHTGSASILAELFPAERVWLNDPRTGQRIAYGRTPLIDKIIEHRSSNSIDISAPTQNALLQLAGVLVHPESAVKTAARWEMDISNAQASFARDRYAVVRDLLPPLQVAALRLHYRSLLAKGFFAFGDSQVERRYWGYQDKIGLFYHRLLTPVACKIAGRALKPSYVYFASYRPGAVLTRHVDREQCEISISFLVDYSPEPEDTSDWPILVESPSRPGIAVAIEQGLGDALFYKGCEVYHHRDALPDGRTSTSLFFHYVPEEFTASLD